MAVELTSFGAIPNDRSQVARKQNALAWLAAMRDMGTFEIPRTKRLLISGGEFYFPGSVYLSRGCIVQGEGGSANTVSRMLFPFNSAGIIADYPSSTRPVPDGRGFAAWGQVEHLDLINEGPSSIVQRWVGRSYTPGDFVISSGNDHVIFKCVVGGVTSEVPEQFDLAVPGDTIREANGTEWFTLAKTPDFYLKVSVWEPDAHYEVGDIVVSSGFEKGGQHYGDNRFTYICAVAGQSGATDPFGPMAPDTEYQEPNGPVWQVRVWSAILMRSAITVDHISTKNWPNSAVHVSSYDANANNFWITNLKSTWDGMGIYVAGTDANVGYVGHCQVLGPGTYTPGRGGHGFWDHSLSSNLWINNYVEDGSGAGWISDSTGRTTWINNVAEMSVHSIVLRGQAIAVAGSAWHPTVIQQLTHFELGGSRELSTLSSIGESTLQTWRGWRGSVDIFQTTDDQGMYYTREYSGGWYTDQFAGAGFTTVNIGGLSGLRASEGEAHAWTADGLFIGPRHAKRYLGFNPDIWESNRLRQGKRKVGDLFFLTSNDDPGGWAMHTVTRDGTKGHPWWPNYSYLQRQPGGRLQNVGTAYSPTYRTPAAHTVEFDDGYAYACTRSGNSGSSKPLLGSSTILGPNAPVWQSRANLWPDTLVRPTSANGHYYVLKEHPEWTANTPIIPDQIIVSYGKFFYAPVLRWIPNTRIQVDSRMQPTVANGKVYKIKKTIDSLGIASIGVTGPTEPDWSLLVLSSDELHDGTLVWKLDQLKTGSAVPHGWDTRPGGITYDNNIEWHHFELRTGGTEPRWNANPGSEIVDTPNALPLPDADGTSMVQAGFGVVWLEKGLDPAEAKIIDGECEWTRIDTVPVTAKVFPAASTPLPEPVEPLLLTLQSNSLTNVDDAAGRWQYSGGKVFHESQHIANFASSKRIVFGGTDTQNTAMLTLTLFFLDTTSTAVENMTLLGSHEFSNGNQIGSVGAASTKYASYISRQFKAVGDVLEIR
jgi:hypothetical protein